jgi:hypothetical protein
MVKVGLSIDVAIGIALGLLPAPDWYFDFSAVTALISLFSSGGHGSPRCLGRKTGERP